jgi:lipoprotein-anchoring transpeptidase ErfK/SrfK
LVRPIGEASVLLRSSLQTEGGRYKSASHKTRCVLGATLFKAILFVKFIVFSALRVACHVPFLSAKVRMVREQGAIMNRPGDPEANGQVAFRLLVILAFLAALVLGAIRASAQTVPQAETKSAAQPATTPKSAPTRRIVVSIPDRKLALIEDEHVVKVYDIAVGAPVSPSPAGEYQVAKRLENPTYYHSGVVIGPGVNNPLGPRWIGLNVKGYGIHGTNHPHSIGKNASHGCIRLRNRDIQDLFARVQVGDRVSLIAERNDEVARLFGLAPDSTGAAETLEAKNASIAAPEDDAHSER